MAIIHVLIFLIAGHHILSYGFYIIVKEEEQESAVVAGDVGRAGKPRLMEVWAGCGQGMGNSPEELSIPCP